MPETFATCHFIKLGCAQQPNVHKHSFLVLCRIDPPTSKGLVLLENHSFTFRRLLQLLEFDWRKPPAWSLVCNLSTSKAHILVTKEHHKEKTNSFPWKSIDMQSLAFKSYAKMLKSFANQISDDVPSIAVHISSVETWLVILCAVPVYSGSNQLAGIRKRLDTPTAQDASHAMMLAVSSQGSS